MRYVLVPVGGVKLSLWRPEPMSSTNVHEPFTRRWSAIVSPGTVPQVTVAVVPDDENVSGSRWNTTRAAVVSHSTVESWVLLDDVYIGRHRPVAAETSWYTGVAPLETCCTYHCWASALDAVCTVTAAALATFAAGRFWGKVGPVVPLGIVIYLALRFEWKFAVAGIIANLHDVVIILGFFAFFQWEFSLSVLAAVLAVLAGSDPVEFRLRNIPEADPSAGKPFSSNRLADCIRIGAERFGWSGRPKVPGSRREGEWLIGFGMSGVIRVNMLGDSTARVTLTVRAPPAAIGRPSAR